MIIRILFLLLCYCSLFYGSTSYSMIDEISSEKILTQNDLDLLSEEGLPEEKTIVFSGSFEGDDIWENLEKKISNVTNLSLKFVNQSTFVKEKNRKNFLDSLKKLKKLKNLSLRNQAFLDEDLSKIPEHIELLDLSKTTVLGYGLEFLPKNTKVIGITDTREKNKLTQPQPNMFVFTDDKAFSPANIIQALKQLANNEEEMLHFLENIEYKIFVMGQTHVYKNHLNFQDGIIVNELSDKKGIPKQIVIDSIKHLK